MWQYRLIKRSKNPYYEIQFKHAGFFRFLGGWTRLGLATSEIEGRDVIKRNIQKDKFEYSKEKIEIIKVFKP